MQSLKISNIEKIDEDFLAELKKMVSARYPRAKFKLGEKTYYLLETSPAIKKIDERLSQDPALKAELEKELDEELANYANHP